MSGRRWKKIDVDKRFDRSVSRKKLMVRYLKLRSIVCNEGEKDD